jgi:hypothetical protein
MKRITPPDELARRPQQKKGEGRVVYAYAPFITMSLFARHMQTINFHITPSPELESTFSSANRFPFCYRSLCFVSTRLERLTSSARAKETSARTSQIGSRKNSTAQARTQNVDLKKHDIERED